MSELIRSQLIWLTIPGEPGLGSGRPPTVHPLEASQEGLAAALGAMSTQRRSHGAGSLAWGRGERSRLSSRGRVAPATPLASVAGMPLRPGPLQEPPPLSRTWPPRGRPQTSHLYLPKPKFSFSACRRMVWGGNDGFLLCMILYTEAKGQLTCHLLEATFLPEAEPAKGKV